MELDSFNVRLLLRWNILIENCDLGAEFYHSLRIWKLLKHSDYVISEVE